MVCRCSFLPERRWRQEASLYDAVSSKLGQNVKKVLFMMSVMVAIGKDETRERKKTSCVAELKSDEQLDGGSHTDSDYLVGFFFFHVGCSDRIRG